MKLLQAAQQRSHQPEPAAQPESDSQAESRPKLNAQNGSD